MTYTKIKPVLPYAGLPALALALLLARAGRMDPFLLLLYELALVFGYIAAVLDLKTKRIPNSLIMLMAASWVFVMMPMLFKSTETALAHLKESTLGFAVGGGLFLLVYIISRKGLGGGDVKFVAAVGLYLGVGGIIPVMLYGTLLAALTGLALILLKKIGRKDPIPLAPFLYIGMLLTLFLQ